MLFELSVEYVNRYRLVRCIFDKFGVVLVPVPQVEDLSVVRSMAVVAVPVVIRWRLCFFASWVVPRGASLEQPVQHAAIVSRAATVASLAA